MIGFDGSEGQLREICKVLEEYDEVAKACRVKLGVVMNEHPTLTGPFETVKGVKFTAAGREWEGDVAGDTPFFNVAVDEFLLGKQYKRGPLAGSSHCVTCRVTGGRWGAVRYINQAFQPFNKIQREAKKSEIKPWWFENAILGRIKPLSGVLAPPYSGAEVITYLSPPTESSPPPTQGGAKKLKPTPCTCGEPGPCLAGKGNHLFRPS